MKLRTEFHCWNSKMRAFGAFQRSSLLLRRRRANNEPYALVPSGSFCTDNGFETTSNGSSRVNIFDRHLKRKQVSSNLKDWKQKKKSLIYNISLVIVKEIWNCWLNSLFNLLVLKKTNIFCDLELYDIGLAEQSQLYYAFDLV